MHRFLALTLALLWLVPLAQGQDDPNPRDRATIFSGDSQDSLLLKHIWRRLGGPGDTPTGGSTGGGSITTGAAVSTVSNDTAITATTTSGTALSANASRLNATIVNYGTVGCFLSLTATATVGPGIWIGPNGGSYSIDANNLYRGIITVITASGTTTLSIHEGQ